TFAELDAESDAVCASLLGAGVCREEVVGICAERLPETIIAMLGVLKAGACFVPIDPAQPQARRRMIVSEAGVRFILGPGKSRSEWPRSFAFLAVDSDVVRPQPKPAWPVCGLAAAYVILTSGTTGTPKAVVIEHKSLCNLVRAQMDAFAIEPTSVVLQFA